MQRVLLFVSGMNLWCSAVCSVAGYACAGQLSLATLLRISSNMDRCKIGVCYLAIAINVLCICETVSLL